MAKRSTLAKRGTLAKLKAKLNSVHADHQHLSGRASKAGTIHVGILVLKSQAPVTVRVTVTHEPAGAAAAPPHA